MLWQVDKSMSVVCIMFRVPVGKGFKFDSYHFRLGWHRQLPICFHSFVLAYMDYINMLIHIIYRYIYHHYTYIYIYTPHSQADLWAMELLTRSSEARPVPHCLSVSQAMLRQISLTSATWQAKVTMVAEGSALKIRVVHKDVSENRGFPSNHPWINRVFHHKPSILG